MSKTKKITYIAVLIALQVVIGRFAGIMTPIVSINLSFIPLVINAIVFGPVSSTISAAAADVLGAFLFPQGLGTFFPGYTLSAALNGLIYGLILYRKPKRLWRICLACLITSVAISLGLSTYWVYMMTGKGVIALLPARLIQNAIMFPIKIFMIWVVVYRIVSLVWKDAVPIDKIVKSQKQIPKNE